MTFARPKIDLPGQKVNELGLTLRDYEGSLSTLCAGCGHDSITAALVQALWEMSTRPEQLIKMSGGDPDAVDSLEQLQNRMTKDEIARAQVGGGPLTGRVRLESVDPLGTLSFEGGLESAAFAALLSGLLPDAGGAGDEEHTGDRQ